MRRARDISRTTTRSAERTVAKRSANDRQRKAMERRCRAPRAKRGCRPGSCGGAKGLEAHQHKQWQRSSVRQHLVPTRRRSGHRGSHVGEYAGLLCANQPLASHLDGGIDSTLVLALGCRPAICAGGAVMSWTQSIRAAGGRRGLHFTLKPRRGAREAAMSVSSRTQDTEIRTWGCTCEERHGKQAESIDAIRVKALCRGAGRLTPAK